MISSLSARLLIAVSLVLAVFFGATVVALDSAFRHTAERAVEDRLNIQIFLLLAEAEPQPDGSLALPTDLPEPRFSTPGSGLYGQINDASGVLIWRSGSAVGTHLPMPTDGTVGEAVFMRTGLASAETVFMHSLLVEWEFEDGSTSRYRFGVAESLEPYIAQVRRFRRQIFGWFAGLAVALVITLGLLLRWVLTPLRKIEREIVEVETGQRVELSGTYPRELQGLTQNTNRLIVAERSRLERYRNTLGNLAHSLKTPLAVLRSSLGQTPRDDTEVQSQLSRIDEIITYQLNRAAASGGVTLGQKPVVLTDVLPGIVRTLDKVYADNAVVCTMQIAEDALYYGDEGDLVEIAGNLMDNAYKYCKKAVFVKAFAVTDEDLRRSGLKLVVEDDGPGIDEADAEAVLQRGVRADERATGHGIGLAVVREIVQLGGGTLSIGRSDHGGARIVCEFPPL